MAKRFQIDKWWTIERRIKYEQLLSTMRWKLNYALAIDKPARKNLPEQECRFGDLIKTTTPTVGVVIGTFGSPAYIALQLAVRKLHWPDVPVLIQDDSSPEFDSLTAVCSLFDADLISTPERCGWCIGDLSALVSGIDWAGKNQIEILVKVSRRYILNHNWVPGLQQLAYGSQYPTFGCGCGYFGFQFRSECFAIHVPSWLASGVVDELRDIVQEGRQVPPPIENWYLQLAQQVYYKQASPIVRRFDYLFPRDNSCSGYARWPMMGISRKYKMPGILWHDIETDEDYYELAQQLGLSQYQIDDFKLPGFQESVRTEAEVMQNRNPLLRK